MGTCKYCGQDAGFFSHAHKECEEKHEQGVVKLEDGINRYFTDAIRINDLTRLVAKLKRGNYVIDADIAAATAKCIEEYTENTHWPYHSHQLDLVSEPSYTEFRITSSTQPYGAPKYHTRRSSV